MELIKKLDRRKNKTGVCNVRWGLFLCPFCVKEIERCVTNGKRCKSCGCAKIKHRGIKTRLYRIWLAMKERCLNPNTPSYKNYGGRGIKVCDEWLEYINFRDWAMNNGYRDDLQIDRIENNGDYEPNNCRFVTHTVNSQNRRCSRFSMNEIIELRKICKFGNFSQKRIVKAYNISQALLSNIMNNKVWKEEGGISA